MLLQTAKYFVLKNETRVENFSKGLFGEYKEIKFNKDLNIAVEQTKKILWNRPNIVAEAYFNYDNNFCSVDILKNDTDGAKIYEVNIIKRFILFI